VRVNLVPQQPSNLTQQSHHKTNQTANASHFLMQNPSWLCW